MKTLILLMALVTTDAVAQSGASSDKITFQIAPEACKVRSIGEVHLHLNESWPQKATLIMHSAEWELRDVTHHRLAGRIPAAIYAAIPKALIDRRPARFLPEADNSFNPDVLRHMAPIGPGDYQLALLVNGQRISNVVAFTIDPTFNPELEPTLRVDVLEAPPGEKWGSLGYWIVGPTPQDPKFKEMAVAMPGIWVDGQIVRREGAGEWIGPDNVFRPGETEVRTFSLKDELPGIDPSRPHEVYAKAAGYVSPTVTLNFGDQSLATSWDAATPTLGPAPPAPVPLLTGRVLGRDGKPAAGWWVSLEQNTWPGIVELTDADGHYAFPGVAPGFYILVCSPTSHTPTNLDFSNVQLVAGETRQFDMSWVPPYSFTGTVTDAKGHGLNHIKVTATWHDTVTGGDCTTTDLTWRDGSYTLKGPFPTIVSAFLMDGPQTPYGKPITPGAKNIDFVKSDKK